MKNNFSPAVIGCEFALKVAAFATLLEAEQLAGLIARGFAPSTVNQINYEVSIKPGAKYVKVDVGSSGKYMVEVITGNIFGIKGYGTPHKGHFYGTLDTVAEYDWSQYYPSRRDGSLARQKANGCPVITKAPEVAA